jgi:hypothetical protein
LLAATMLTRTVKLTTYSIQQTKTNKQKTVKGFYQGIPGLSTYNFFLSSRDKDWRTELSGSPLREYRLHTHTHTLTPRYCLANEGNYLTLRVGDPLRSRIQECVSKFVSFGGPLGCYQFTEGVAETVLRTNDSNYGKTEKANI